VFSGIESPDGNDSLKHANKLRERAGVRGPSLNAATTKAPSSDLTATFSPEGEKGLWKLCEIEP
jgi:hypothetical protein